MTATQFVVQMILAYAATYPALGTEDAMARAAETYQQFLRDERAQFGDPRFAWDRSAAFTIVAEYEYGT